MLEVLLVDDHPIVAMGLNLALRSHPFLSFMGSFARLEEASAAGLGTPDVVVLDLVFDSRVEPDIVTRCRARWPAARIVVFSTLPKADWSLRLLETGAGGYIEKTGRIGELVCELERVAHPGSLTDAHDHRAAPRVASSPGTNGSTILDSLTRREREIAELVAHGRSTNEIAMTLAISRNTVAVHQENIRRKLACDSIKSLIAKLATLRAAYR